MLQRNIKDIVASSRLSTAAQRTWFLLLLTAAVLTRLPAFFHSFFSGDEATYSALAVRLLDGALPYLGAVDHKPVGITLAYAAVYSLAGPYRLWAIRAVLVLSVALTGLVIGLFAEVLHGDRDRGAHCPAGVGRTACRSS